MFHMRANIVAMGVIGAALLLPGLAQVNGQVIALLLPIHLGVAAGLLRATRPGRAPVRRPPPGTPGTR